METSVQAREQYLQGRGLWEDLTYFVNDKKFMMEGRKNETGEMVGIHVIKVCVHETKGFGFNGKSSEIFSRRVT